MRKFSIPVSRLFALVLCLLPAFAFAGDFDRFAGTFTGAAEFSFDGEVRYRDMSTTIEPTKDGFVLTWTSISRKDDGRAKAKTYKIKFAPSVRPNIYGSAMRTNVFGKAIPLDPLKGDPFVWARLIGDTLSVFSLFIDETGEYEMQEYHRTLVDQGLELEFLLVRDGKPLKTIKTLLKRAN